MFRVPLSGVLRRHFASMASPSQTPVEDIIRIKVHSHSALSAFNPLTREQVTEALKPTLLEISNDSAAHSHHQAMEGSTSKETHFRLVGPRCNHEAVANYFQSEHSLGCFQIQKATRSPSNDLRFVEGRARSTRRNPCPSTADKDSGGRSEASFQSW